MLGLKLYPGIFRKQGKQAHAPCISLQDASSGKPNAVASNASMFVKQPTMERDREVCWCSLWNWVFNSIRFCQQIYLRKENKFYYFTGMTGDLE